MLRRLLPLIACVLFVQFAQPSVAAPVPATGKWVVNFADENCVATRLYQVNSEEVALAFEPRPLSERTRILLQAKGIQSGISRESLRAYVGEERLDVRDATAYPSTKEDHTVYLFGATREELEKLASAQRLQVAVRGGPKLDLQVPELGAVLGHLDTCMADLLATWGLSEADQARLASPPKPKGSIFRPDDYPREALGGGAVGDVEARAWIDADGEPSDCRIIRSSGHDSLDKVSCRMLLRARFKPAMDNSGQPMASPYHLIVGWRLMF